jgi:hypothetical protein
MGRGNREYVIDPPDKSEGIPIYRIGRRTPNGIDWFEGASSLKEAKARLAGAKADAVKAPEGPAPNLDHLRRENAIPATPPKPNAEPTPVDETVAERIRYQEDVAKSLKDSRKAFRERHKDNPDMLRKFENGMKQAQRVARNERIALDIKHDVTGQKRVPAAGGAPNPRGGEWTK